LLPRREGIANARVAIGVNRRIGATFGQRKGEANGRKDWEEDKEK
jgi:hypothetical protein